MILAFDTSAAHVVACLFDGSAVRACRAEEMARGQAERLFPVLEEVLAEARMQWSDVSRIGVGVGPGNFTGIRISVAAARGLALSLDIPAIGVSALEAQAYGLGAITSVVDARRDRAYAQRFPDGAPALLARDALPSGPYVGGNIDGALEPRVPMAEAIARIAANREDMSAPKPLYLRAADAAPAKDRGPVILDDA
ncbi:tRNA (adenosine(37)-N6)-threonylcarbamoyltransferase complex dimerization subunit type 1 TsaB [Roseobacteraceae bacterium S113]